MNTYATIIAGSSAVPGITGIITREPGGISRHSPGQFPSGIRGAGQYCRCPGYPGTRQTLTAACTNSRMMAVRGMSP